MVMDLPCRDPQISETIKGYPYFARLLAEWTQTFGEDWHSSPVVSTTISVRQTSEPSVIDQYHSTGVIIIMDVKAESTEGLYVFKNLGNEDCLEYYESYWGPLKVEAELGMCLQRTMRPKPS